MVAIVGKGSGGGDPIPIILFYFGFKKLVGVLKIITVWMCKSKSISSIWSLNGEIKVELLILDIFFSMLNEMPVNEWHYISVGL